MKKRLFSTFLALFMTFSLVQTPVFAADETPEAEAVTESASVSLEDALDTEETTLPMAESSDEAATFATDTSSEEDTTPAADESSSESTPATPATSGTCGAGLTWTFENETLTISGSGAMTDYATSKGYTDRPWEALTIKSVVIENGVTSVGSAAFQDTGSLQEISIPDSVTSIGDRAFRYCQNLTIIIPKSVKKVGALGLWLGENARIQYKGTEDEWNAIEFLLDDYEEEAVDATIQFNYGASSDSGNETPSTKPDDTPDTSSNSVQITDPNGVLPEGITMNVAENAEKAVESTKAALNALSVKFAGVVVFDITLTTADGTAIHKLDGPVTVSLPIPEEYQNQKNLLRVYYIDDSGKAELLTSQVSGNNLLFSTDHFSSYAMVLLSPEAAQAPNANVTKSPATATGDYAHVLVWLLLAAGGIVTIVFIKKKNPVR